MIWFLKALSWGFRLLPHRLASATACLLGWIWFYLIPIRRRVARSNLEQAFPQLSKKSRGKIARRCYVHLSTSAVEFLRMPSLTSARAEAMIERVGGSLLQQAVDCGKGVVIATAHLGNFDLMACVEALRGIPLNIVTREQHVKGINRFWMELRARFGLGFIAPKNSIWKIHRLLKEGQVVAMTIDQHMPVGKGIPMPFFHRLASTTPAPALMAVSTGAVLLCASTERIAGQKHRILIEAPIQIQVNADRQKEILRVTQALNIWLENRIRHCPEQWLWIHRRYKSLEGF